MTLFCSIQFQNSVLDCDKVESNSSLYLAVCRMQSEVSGESCVDCNITILCFQHHGHRVIFKKSVDIKNKLYSSNFSDINLCLEMLMMTEKMITTDRMRKQ